MPEAAPAATSAAPPPPPAAPPAASPPPAPAAGVAPPATPAGAAPNGQPADAPKSGSPASAFELKLPEGAEKWLDPKAVEKFKSIMADPKTTNAEKAKVFLEDVIAERKALTEQAEQMRVKDAEALKSDPDFGGAKFDRTVADARSALQQFGGEKVSKLFLAYGIDKDPDLTKMFARVRAAIAEDDTSSRAPKPAPDEPKAPPQTQTQRLAQRYDKKK